MRVKNEILYYVGELKYAFFSIDLLRIPTVWIFTPFALWLLAVRKNTFMACSIVCKFLKYLSLRSECLYSFFSKKMRDKILHGDVSCSNGVLSDYLKTQESKDFRSEFLKYPLPDCLRLRYPRENDSSKRQGDLLVLKPYKGINEKGVLYLQYNDSFKKFVSLFDCEKIARRYRLVLEPSTWGYQDVVFLLFAGLNTDVIVESQYEPDYNYIEGLKCNLRPIRLGAGDWVDFELFNRHSSTIKKYDVVMVASWQRLKRHDVLFRALRERVKFTRVALVGYPSGGRTVKDIQKIARCYGVDSSIDYYERISPTKVATLIGQSRVNVMLSRREGANKGIYESLFCDVPVILTAQNVGVNRDHINDMTGCLVTDTELTSAIEIILSGDSSFSPRDWALTNSGYVQSTKKLNAFLSGLALSQGEVWTTDIFQKKNCTNATYVHDYDRLIADMEIEKLKYFIRENCKD